MKTWQIASLSVLLFFVGCKKDDNIVDQRNETLVIASVLPSQKESLVLMGGGSGEGAWAPMYICKYLNASEWRLWYSDLQIRGFDEIYEEGYEYCIEVRTTYYRPDPKLQDHNPRDCKLVKLLFKERKESQDIPADYLEE